MSATRHALIIEDEMLIGMAMQEVLGGLGFASFAFASTARQAVELARLQRPDLVTADISLLDGDGLEACRALEEECGPLPVIYVTGQDEPPAVDGRHALVAKPFSEADIAKAYAAVGGRAQAA